jgi:hypothetical protein
MNTSFLIDITIDEQTLNITNSSSIITYLDCQYIPACDIISINFSPTSQIIEMIIHSNDIISIIKERIYHDKIVEIKSIIGGKYASYFSGFILSFIENDNGSFVATITSKLAMLRKEIGTFFSKTCRATFCDAKCGLSINNFQHQVYVINIDSHFISFSTDVSNLNVTDGVFSVLSGNCKGFQSRILGLKTNTSISLFDDPRYDINGNDICIITEGCDKTLNSCKKYKNVVNFRGEPFINE